MGYTNADLLHSMQSKKEILISGAVKNIHTINVIINPYAVGWDA